MTDEITGSGSHRYGNTTLSDSASAVLGDQYQIEYGNRIYNIENAHFTQVPSGDLTHINDHFDKLPRPDLSLQKSTSTSEGEFSSFIEQISDYNAEVEHWKRSSLIIDGTCHWLFQHVRYKDWDTSTGSSFACTGAVGSGKSILAAALIEHLKRTKISETGLVAHYYLDASRAETSTAQDILCALLKQCVRKLRTSSHGITVDMMSTIRELRSASFSGLETNKATEFMKSLLTKMTQSVLVIDGFDRLPEMQIQVLFGMFRKMAQVMKQSDCKVAFFGREILGRGIDIDTQLPNCFHLGLDYPILKGDIERFISVQMADFQAQRRLTENSQLLVRVEQTLKQRGKAMFLWIHLQLLNIWNPHLSRCDADIDDLLGNLPSNLVDTYRWCIGRIESNRDGDIAQKAFRWVLHAKIPLTSQQLREFVSFSPDGTIPTSSTIINACVTQYCANLLIIDAMGCVSFTHSSVVQFLLNGDVLGDQYSKYKLSPRADLPCSLICLQYLAALQSRQQVVVRKQLQMPTSYGKDLIQETIKMPKWFKLPTVFHRKTHSTPIVVPLHIPRTTPTTTLSVHQYVIRYWLEHTRDIRGTKCEHLFNQVYYSSTPDIWPAMPKGLTQSDQKGYLFRLGVHLNHIPLLENIAYGSKSIDFLARIDAMAAFADNEGSLLHMAAALGHNDVLTFCAERAGPGLERGLVALDSSGRSPLAWAAQSEHMDTVMWILGKSGLSSSFECRSLGPHRFPLCIWAILAALPSLESFIYLHETQYSIDVLHSHSERVRSQTIFAGLLNGNTDILNFVQRVDLLDLHPFHYPGIDFQLKGSLIELAVKMKHSSLLRTAMDLLDIDTALRELSHIAKTTRLPWKLVSDLFESERYILPLLFEPQIRHNTGIKAVDIICAAIEWECLSPQHQISMIMFLMDEASKTHRWREILRNALTRTMLTQSNLDYDSETFSKSVRDVSALPTDIMCQLFSSPKLRAIGQEWFKPQPKNLLLERSTLHYCASLAVTPVDGVQPRDEQTLELSPSYYVYYAAIPNEPQLWWKRMPSRLESIEDSVQHSMFAEEAIIQHRIILEQHKKELDFECRLKLLRLWRLIYAVANDPQIYNRWRHQTILDKFWTLYKAGSDGIFDLNFPCGYFKNDENKWQVNPSIVCAIYRWNYRIRRRKDLPFSDAETYYAPSCNERRAGPYEIRRDLDFRLWLLGWKTAKCVECTRLSLAIKMIGLNDREFQNTWICEGCQVR